MLMELTNINEKCGVDLPVTKNYFELLEYGQRNGLPITPAMKTRWRRVAVLELTQARNKYKFKREFDCYLRETIRTFGQKYKAPTPAKARENQIKWQVGQMKRVKDQNPCFELLYIVDGWRIATSCCMLVGFKVGEADGQAHYYDSVDGELKPYDNNLSSIVATDSDGKSTFKKPLEYQFEGAVGTLYDYSEEVFTNPILQDTVILEDTEEYEYGLGYKEFVTWVNMFPSSTIHKITNNGRALVYQANGCYAVHILAKRYKGSK